MTLRMCSVVVVFYRQLVSFRSLSVSVRWSGGFFYIYKYYIIYFRHCQERFRPAAAAGSAGSDSAAGSAVAAGSGSGSAGSAAGSGSAAAAVVVVVVVVVVAADGDDAPGDVLPCLGPLVFFLGCFFEENRVYYHVYLIMIGS